MFRSVNPSKSPNIKNPTDIVFACERETELAEILPEVVETPPFPKEAPEWDSVTPDNLFQLSNPPAVSASPKL